MSYCDCRVRLEGLGQINSPRCWLILAFDAGAPTGAHAACDTVRNEKVTIQSPTASNHHRKIERNSRGGLAPERAAARLGRFFDACTSISPSQEEFARQVMTAAPDLCALLQINRRLAQSLGPTCGGGMRLNRPLLL